MGLQRCENGHYFDPEKHMSCPSCGVAPLPGRRTVPKQEVVPSVVKPAPPSDEAPGRPSGGRAGKTVPLVEVEVGVDPVVGWLVCVEGPDRGRDYRIRSERNFIGRAEDMDVCVAGDDTISRDRHAIVSFNPKKNQFKVLPGEGRGLVYCNGEEVDRPCLLSQGDTIELGKTKLLLVPLCGDDFTWD